MRSKWPLAACLIVGAGYLLLWHARITWMGDDGFFVQHAQRILEGQVPYRDFWTHTTPASIYLLAAMFKVFGSHWILTRLLATTLILAQAAMVYALIRRLSPSRLLASLGFCLIVAPSAWNPFYSHHHVSAVLALGSTFAWWQWMETRRLKFVALAAAADALVVWSSQNKGALLVLAGVLILLAVGPHERRERLRALGTYAGVGGIFTILLVAFLLATGAWGEFLNDCVVFVARDYTQSSSVPYGTTYNHASGWRGIVVTSSVAWYIVATPLALLVESVFFVRDRRKLPSTALLLVQGWAAFGAALHRPDVDHLLYVCHLPTVLLLVRLGSLAGMRAGREARDRAIGWGAIVLLVLVAASALGPAAYWTRKMLRRPRHEIEAARDRAWTQSEGLAKTIHALNAHLREHAAPGEPVFAYPHSALYYRFLDRPNPTRYDALVEGISSDAQVQEVIRVLEERRVRYVIVDTMWSRDFTRTLYPSADLDLQGGPFMRYVQERYEPELVLPTATLWRRKILSATSGPPGDP